jgi:hypothetical protein
MREERPLLRMREVRLVLLAEDSRPLHHDVEEVSQVDKAGHKAHHPHRRRRLGKSISFLVCQEDTMIKIMII